jgi:hypothetical protein
LSYEKEAGRAGAGDMEDSPTAGKAGFSRQNVKDMGDEGIRHGLGTTKGELVGFRIIHTYFRFFDFSIHPDGKYAR